MHWLQHLLLLDVYKTPDEGIFILGQVPTLVDFAQHILGNQMIVAAQTRIEVDYLARREKREGIEAIPIDQPMHQTGALLELQGAYSDGRDKI